MLVEHIETKVAKDTIELACSAVIKVPIYYEKRKVLNSRISDLQEELKDHLSPQGYSVLQRKQVLEREIEEIIETLCGKEEEEKSPESEAPETETEPDHTASESYSLTIGAQMTGTASTTFQPEDTLQIEATPQTQDNPNDIEIISISSTEYATQDSPVTLAGIEESNNSTAEKDSTVSVKLEPISEEETEQMKPEPLSEGDNEGDTVKVKLEPISEEDLLDVKLEPFTGDDEENLEEDTLNSFSESELEERETSGPEDTDATDWGRESMDEEEARTLIKRKHNDKDEFGADKATSSKKKI
ncbi:hypothetical protein K501DRAFT_275504 [Backusella circina FSU 941]|nr:hypothetical protein K501DRAFT_275504 [Backusella circina FSU 941]